MLPEVNKMFQDNVVRYGDESKRFSRRSEIFSLARVVLFLLVVSLTAYFLYQGQSLIAVLVFFLGVGAFGIMVNLHRKVSFELRQRQILIRINEEELLRGEGDLSSFDQGSDFSDPEHAYIADLDIFGSNSLFQLINRTTTPTGQNRLASWMTTPASKAVIHERQQAIEEMAKRPEWNQNFIAFPRHKDHGIEDREFEIFKRWINPDDRVNLTNRRLIAVVLGVINLAIVLMVSFSYLSWSFIFLAVVIGVIAVKNLQQEMLRSMEVSRVGVHLMETYEMLTRSLLAEEWQSDAIVRATKQLDQPVSALEEMGRLKKLLHTLASRFNPLYAIFNVYFVIDIHLIVSLEKWKRRNAAHFSEWMDALSELEALSGLAAYQTANPDYVVPMIEDPGYQLKAESLGHPLIPASSRVRNDFVIQGKGHIGVVTGSNMSGKSTFLRTVGVNLVLAQMGAPVCASALSIAPIGIFTSMRTADNLEESVSSFYAELRRIEKLIKLIDEGVPVFFILDEILKGTNTEDRQLGARSLVKQLSKGDGMGLISTHDISLGDLASTESNITNWHFSSEVVNNDLIFDYTLKRGVCQSFNASELMEKIGIKLERKSS